MESTNESLQIETKEEVFHAIDDSVKKELFILDEILTAESAESTLTLDGDTNSGGQQQKEVMVFKLQITLLICLLGFLCKSFLTRQQKWYQTNSIIHYQGWALTGGSEEIAKCFDELVPDMALDFPFELDPFQKEVLFIFS